MKIEPGKSFFDKLEIKGCQDLSDELKAFEFIDILKRGLKDPKVKDKFIDMMKESYGKSCEEAQEIIDQVLQLLEESPEKLAMALSCLLRVPGNLEFVEKEIVGDLLEDNRNIGKSIS